MNHRTDFFLCCRNRGTLFPYVIWEPVVRNEDTIRNNRWVEVDRVYYKCLHWSVKYDRVELSYIMDSHEPTFFGIITDDLDKLLRTKYPWREGTQETLERPSTSD